MSLRQSPSREKTGICFTMPLTILNSTSDLSKYNQHLIHAYFNRFDNIHQLVYRAFRKKKKKCTPRRESGRFLSSVSYEVRGVAQGLKTYEVGIALISE